jgi:glycolate oxidase iron-sulfur subunit
MMEPIDGPADAPQRMMQPMGGPADALRREEAGLLACVHCGFCLDACPTYRRVGHEGDSPRGRLDLMRAVAEGRLEADDPAFHRHIDRCLGCRACEPVCPSGVPYGFLLERARGTMAEAKGISLTTRLLIHAYTGPLLPLVTAASRVLRGSGLAGLLTRIMPARPAGPRFGLAMLASTRAWRGLRDAPGGSGRAAVPSASVPPAPPAAEPQPGGPAGDIATDPQRAFADPHALAGAYPQATAVPAERARAAAGPAEGAVADVKVALLDGCVQQSLFARVNAATRRVLAANGCTVVPAPGQRCCGALDAHAGRLEETQALARANIEAFEAAGVELVVVNAAGCGAIMKEYGEQLKDDPEWAERAHAFTARVRDVSEFLAERGVRPGGELRLRVTYDAPCHLLHAQRIRSAPLQLLDAIPGLEHVPLPDADECCGGAGLYGVHHPELGGRILADKLEAIRGTGATVVTTPNPGCMMQIGAGLLLAGDDVRVLHPMELLDESYRRMGEGE